ncbi:ABC transporter substrate-binding protein [Azospirillum halopraeferens]|uniref:ABC transporter substrate-binding protein n=1 Tax=Azospirillum halopraeferens TaxID=34010 RepID=UPI0004243A69|nr:ABC transporter substrate-binding protein [Azospirillum halopraeferens]
MTADTRRPARRSFVHGALALGAALGMAAAVAVTAGPALAAGTVRVAFGDIASVETLHFLIALERAKERGVDVAVTYFKSEDLAAQAVVGGQADIGVGAPYALVQKVRAPIRFFYQMSTLNFYPIVNTQKYRSWKDLDGQEITVHSRGSGTEAIMRLMADKHGITYKTISYVPGSEVRAGAMLQGTINASIVDSTNRRILMEKAPDRFAVLPMEGVSATDEALYANTDYLTREMDVIEILVESLVTTWREVNDDPDAVAALRERYNLLPDLPRELEADIGPYFHEAADSRMLPLNGGGEEAVADDFAFYTLSGQLEGEAAALKVADFWDLRPLDAVLAKVGRR